MSTFLNAEQLRAMIVVVADRIIDNAERLGAADRNIGDGDHGLGMERGFSAVKAALGDATSASAPSILKMTGDIMIDRMGGASGIVFGLMFRGGFSGAQGGPDISLDDFARYLRRSATEIMSRGGAKPGDKTMLDALEPAVAALENAARAGDPISNAFEKAALAAEQGCEATRNFIARFGKASTMGERSLGFIDAGALSTSLIFRAMSDWAQAQLVERI